MKIVTAWAPKGTAWSVHPRDNRKMPTHRADYFITFQRIYVRKTKKYCYQLILGRFMILVGFK